jgi:PAP2 superfamily
MKSLKAILPIMLCAMVACKQKSNEYKTAFSNPILFCKTVKQLNDVVLENNFPPVIASRNYVYANIAAYECVAAGDSSFKSLYTQIKHLPKMPLADASKKVNYSLAALLSFTKVGNAVTFPEGSMMGYYDELKNMADSLGMPEDVLQNTIIYSDSVVATIMRWSKKDNYAQTRTAEKYSVQSDIEGRWIPTPPMYASSLEPHWREIRTMILDSAAEFQPTAPPTFDIKNKSSIYYKALLEVKTIGDSLNEEQKLIADFWDDNPFKMNVVGHASYATKKFSPPGHWMNIVGIAAKTAKADFNTTVAAYTQTAISLFDGFISCWDEKFKTNCARPETIINKYITDAWRPYIQTPPFPSYTSGHATISAAAAEVMTKWFGDNLVLSDTSQLEFGIKARNIESFRKASKEAALSRLYGGIHFRHDNEAGNVMGTKIGIFVLDKLKFKK